MNVSGNDLADLAMTAEIIDRLDLDDYGTGCSSLSYLKQLNFDELKIDMSFISNMLNDEKDQKIVRASIHLGHDLGSVVTAEGVEDEPTAHNPFTWL